jgi:UV DNA damage endonuclease
MVLDYHHHNIIHDESLREGTLDVMQLFPEIKATWTRKGITQKQHYSEPCPGAFTGREMRKHSPRVAVLPPCDDTMDLMIEAKDKEQAVFELYKTYSIGGGELFREVIPHQRRDDNRPPPKITKAQLKKMEEEGIEVEPLAEVPDNEVGMGGSERRVYWPPGKEKWLSPMKRVVNRKLRVEMEGEKGEGPAKKPSKEQVTAAPKPAMEKKQAAGRKKAVTENEVELPLAPPLKIKATTREKTSAPLTPPSAYKPSKVAALSVPSLRRGRSASAATAVTTKEVVPPSPESSGLSSPPQSDQEMTDTEEVLTATQKAVFRDTCQPVVNVEKRRRLVV